MNFFVTYVSHRKRQRLIIAEEASVQEGEKQTERPHPNAS